MSTALTLGAWARWDVIRRHIADHSPGSVLEFGPGLGAMGLRLAEGATYEAVEPDPKSRLRAAERLGHRVKASTDELTGDTFAMICAFEVLEHIPDDAAALRKWTRLLEPGGLALFSMPAFGDQFGPHDEAVGHLRRYDPADAEALIAGAELELLDLTLTGFPLGFALQFLRDRLAARKSGEPPPGTDPAATAQARTASSGRLYQIESHGWITEYASWPFRQLQRLPTGRGTGMVIAAQKPRRSS